MPAIDREKDTQGLLLPTESDGVQKAAQDGDQVRVSPAFREITLTVEEARTLQNILDDPKQPAHAGREMPSANPEFLR